MRIVVPKNPTPPITRGAMCSINVDASTHEKLKKISKDSGHSIARVVAMIVAQVEVGK